MARKPVRKRKTVTDKLQENYLPVTDVENADFDSLRKCVRAWHSSRTVHYVEGLSDLLDNNYPLSNWEVEHMREMFEKFAVKYNSPLAKALK